MSGPSATQWNQGAWLRSFADQSDATKAHMQIGLELLSADPFPAAHIDVCLTLFARGMETLIKITLVAQQMKNGEKIQITKSHRIHQYEPDARNRIRQDLTPDIGGYGWLQRVLAFVDADPVLTQLINIIGNYGDKGRYFDIDWIRGEKTRTDLEPTDPNAEPLVSHWTAWRQLVNQTATALGTLPADSHAQSAALARFRLSLITWWELYAGAWIRGLAGPDARRYSPLRLPREFRPSNEQVDERIILPS